MAQPRPARVLALVARAGDLELVERQRGLDLGADPRALEPDDQPAAAPRELLGHRADHPVDQLALRRASRASRRAAGACPSRGRPAAPIRPSGASGGGPGHAGKRAGLDRRPRPEHRAFALRFCVAARAQQRVELVVQPHHRRPQPLLQHAADRRQPGRDVVDLEAAEHPQLLRRRQPQPRRRDHPQRALAAEQELGPARPAQRAARPVGLDHLAAAGHHRQPGAAILDLAVLGRQLPRRPGRQPAAHRRAVDRRREVPERVAAARQLALEPLARQPGLDVAQELGRVHRPDLLHPLGVDRDPAVDRHRAAAHPRAAAVRHDRDPLLAGELDHRHHLADVLGPDDGVRPRRQRPALAVAEQQPRPHVARVGLEVDLPQRHPPRAEDRFELALQAVRIQRSLHEQPRSYRGRGLSGAARASEDHSPGAPAASLTETRRAGLPLGCDAGGFGLTACHISRRSSIARRVRSTGRSCLRG